MRNVEVLSKEIFLAKLISEDRIDAVRMVFYSDAFEEIYKKEYIECCTDEQLNIILSADNFEEILLEYTPSKKFINLVIDGEYSRIDRIKFLLNNYIELFDVGMFEKIIHMKELHEVINSNSSNISSEALVLLDERRILKNLDKYNAAILYGRKAGKKSVIGIDLQQCSVATYCRRFTDEEKEDVVCRILELNEELNMKGNLDNIVRTQDLSKELVKKIFLNLEPNVSESWFLKMLENQDINDEIENILKKVVLTEEAVLKLINNRKISTNRIAVLYEMFADIIVRSNPAILPVLDVHCH